MALGSSNNADMHSLSAAATCSLFGQRGDYSVVKRVTGEGAADGVELLASDNETTATVGQSNCRPGMPPEVRLSLVDS